MLATTAVEETREIVDVPKEQSTVKDDKDATATGEINISHKIWFHYSLLIELLVL